MNLNSHKDFGTIFTEEHNTFVKNKKNAMQVIHDTCGKMTEIATFSTSIKEVALQVTAKFEGHIEKLIGFYSTKIQCETKSKLFWEVIIKELIAITNLLVKYKSPTKRERFIEALLSESHIFHGEMVKSFGDRKEITDFVKSNWQSCILKETKTVKKAEQTVMYYMSVCQDFIISDEFLNMHNNPNPDTLEKCEDTPKEIEMSDNSDIRDEDDHLCQAHNGFQDG
jgi:hypothetical protein